MAAVGGFLCCIWWGAFLPPPGKVAVGLTCPGSEQHFVGSAYRSQTLKGTIQILQHKEFLIPLVFVNKHPLANPRCVTSIKLSVLWLIHTFAMWWAGRSWPGGEPCSWSIFPPMVIEKGRGANLLLGTIPQQFPFSGEVPAQALSTCRGGGSTAQAERSPAKTQSHV